MRVCVCVRLSSFLLSFMFISQMLHQLLRWLAYQWVRTSEKKTNGHEYAHCVYVYISSLI